MTSLISLKRIHACLSAWSAGPCEVCLSKITSDKNADDFESKTIDYGCLKMSRREATGDSSLSCGQHYAS